MEKSAGLILLACVLLSACEYTPTGPVPPNSSSGAAEATNETGDGEVQLSILSFDEIQKLIAGKRGKVVVMDAWSTSCPPCMKDFHNLVELHKEYAPDKLACISLSFDYEGIGQPEDVRDGVLTFLQSQGATFDNVMSNEESDALYRKFKLNSVPAIFVYDRSGKLRKRFEDAGSYKQVRPLVAELVAEASAADGAADKP
jgi:thiol-disulfide isomerase/thioredoxin